MTNAIEAEGLTKRFGSGSTATQALAGVDLAVEQGTILGVLGPNGAGKTTAVRILATLLEADSGHAVVGGYDVRTQAHLVRQHIGLTGQFASVDEDLTGLQNLSMIGRLLDMTGTQARRRASELLEWFDLSDAADRVAKTYSGGMRRRLDLAASLVGRPAIIFLDEPTTGLDPSKREDMWEVVRSLVADGSTVLLTTQYLEEADALADSISVFDHGAVIAHDTPYGLKRVVGGQRLSVRPTDNTRLDDVRAILRDLGNGAVPETAGRDTLSVPVDGDDALTAAVARLHSAAIGVDELSLHLPSLDEVFFTLTGTGTAEPTTHEEDAA